MIRMAILFLLPTLLFCSTAKSQEERNTEVLKQLQSETQREQGLNEVLKTAEAQPAVILIEACIVAAKLERLEDQAFLFYTAQLRRRFDAKAFPPKGKGGNSPLVAINAVLSLIGSSLNPAIMSKPKVFSKAIKRVEQWEPAAPESYRPGYEFSARLPEQEAIEEFAPHKQKFVQAMSKMAQLLNDPDYFDAAELVKRYNGAAPGDKPSEDAKNEAIKTMKRIESQKDLPGPGITNLLFKTTEETE